MKKIQTAGINTALRFSPILAICIVGIFVHWPALSTDYGFFDDYYMLNEYSSGSTKTFSDDIANGRFAAAWIHRLLPTSGTFHDLLWMRRVSAVAIAFFSWVLYHFLISIGTQKHLSLLYSVLFLCLPSTIIYVGWATIFSHSLWLSLPLAAFILSERAFTSGKLVSRLSVATLLMLFVSFAYQPILGIYPLAALLKLCFAREDRTAKFSAVKHALFYVSCLVLAYLTYTFVLKYLIGVTAPSRGGAGTQSFPAHLVVHYGPNAARRLPFFVA